MSTNIYSPGDFAEDHLPPGQPIIQTSNLRRFRNFVDLVLASANDHPTMGVVTGNPGLGKTIAVQALVDDSPLSAHTGLPRIIKYKVQPRSTPRALAVGLLQVLNEKPRGANIYAIADELADAILRNDLQLMIVDEGDRLNEDSFEVLRHIFDKTGCPIVVVGLPTILRVIDRHDKFVSRVGLRMQFRALSVDEVCETVLPNLKFAHWQFDPESEADRQLGEQIWKMVKPSLRKLRNLLQTASYIAKVRKKPRITEKMITEAFQWTASDRDKQRIQKGTDKHAQTETHPHAGELEQRSEQRKDEKRKSEDQNDK